MSYPPNQGWPTQGQQQWGQQPGYPPQGQQYPPPQQPPPHGYGHPQQYQAPYGSQPGYGQPPHPPHSHLQSPPPGQYPPPQQPYGYPPQGHSPQPPTGYGQSPYPPNPSVYPPQGPPHGAPQHGYQQGYQLPPGPPGSAQPGQYTSPPPPQAPYGAPLGPRPSLGYDPQVPCHTDMTYPAQQLRDAMQGAGTDEKTLVQVLSEVPDPVHMLRLRHTYDDRFKRSLLRDLEQETSGHFRTVLVAVARGPLLEDAHLVHQAIAGIGTKETMLNDVVLGRSNADLNAIKQCFQQIYKRDMGREISEDLSMKTEQLFKYVMQAARAEEAAPVLPHDVDAHVDRLHNATEGHRFSANQDEVSKIMAYSSDGMIRAIDQRYKQKHHKSLDELFTRSFSGHMRDALRLMAARAIDPIKSDADQLEAAMKGLGTKDDLLIERLVRSHWNKDHFRQVKIAYTRFHTRNLSDRVSGETSGDYRRMMLALCA